MSWGDAMDFAKLWNNFLDTVTNHYFDTTGRVGRPQFWYYVLVSFLVGLVVGIIASTIHLTFISSLVALALLLPNLGMAIRRLQDTGRSGTLAWAVIGLEAVYAVLGLLGLVLLPLLWLLPLLGLVLLVAGIALIYFCAQPGQPEANAFGPVPPVFDPK
jgi:uncharacterized membrane protein YhaH (DUF805 family)